MIDVHEHVAKVCREACCGVMEQVLHIAIDREQVPADAFLKLTADDIAHLYDSHIGPAIDDIEGALSE